jgi:hypothetical protein
MTSPFETTLPSPSDLGPGDSLVRVFSDHTQTGLTVIVREVWRWSRDGVVIAESQIEAGRYMWSALGGGGTFNYTVPYTIFDTPEIRPHQCCWVAYRNYPRASHAVEFDWDQVGYITDLSRALALFDTLPLL